MATSLTNSTIVIVSDRKVSADPQVNQRDDDYGGTMEKRCRFTLETVDKLCAAIGSGRVAVRLSPFGFFNQTYGEKRVEQWTYLCEQLAKKNLAYV